MTSDESSRHTHEAFACMGGLGLLNNRLGPLLRKLAYSGLVSHVIVPFRANLCEILPQSRFAAPSVHYLFI